jgi:hypothetical protein
MLKMVLGIIVGFVVWTVLWVGSHALFAALSPNWFGKMGTDMADAAGKGIPYQVDSTILILILIESFIVSIISGYVTAAIANENVLSTFILGILLLLVGILIQASIWNYMPLWYHLPFLIFLIPMAVLGGKLKKV